MASIYRQHSFHKSYAALLTIFVAILLITITNPTYARMTKVQGNNMGRQLEKCNTLIDPKEKGDHWTQDSAGLECCSKKYGYCLYCPSGTKHCNKITYRLKYNGINLPEADTLAPVPDNTAPTRPGTMPQMQLQQMQRFNAR